MGAVSYAVNTMQPPFCLLVYRGWETSAILLCMASAQCLFLGIMFPAASPTRGNLSICAPPASMPILLTAEGAVLIERGGSLSW